MLGLNMPGLPVWVSISNNPKRKLKHSLELVELPTGLVGINTANPNRIVKRALDENKIAEVTPFKSFKPEVKYGENSRIDFLVTSDQGQEIYLEVKNVHLSRTHGLAEFPDCETARGVKHLGELSNMVAEGHRAIAFYLVQRTDCEKLSFATDLAPKYAAAVQAAAKAGVEFLCYGCHIDKNEITIGKQLPVELPKAE